MSTLHSPDRRGPRSRWPAGLLTALAVLAMPPARAEDVRAERIRIAAERAAVERRHTQAQAECAKRFVVTTCADDARRERRTALESLNHQTLAIDEAERRRAAAARLRSIDAKAAAHAARQSGSAPSGASGTVPAALIPRGDVDAARAPKNAAAAAEQASAAQQTRARDAAARVVEREEQRKAADEHREAVERRLREREASGRAAGPLPSPASAASR